MKRYAGVVEILSRTLDRIAAFCIAAMTGVVVINIFMRSILGRPLMGTVDYVNILMTLAISLGLAHCALKGGHIAVDFIVEKLSAELQAVVSVAVNFAGILFWGAVVWFMAAFAQNMAATNLLAGTVSIPLYPVVYLTAFGLMALFFILVLRLTEAVRMVRR
jgi:TRAP-type C4-dicarboxylate transport system permease small subunit